MITEMRNHFNKRGIFDFDHLLTFSESNQSCRVCDLCYMLIIAE